MWEKPSVKKSQGDSTGYVSMRDVDLERYENVREGQEADRRVLRMLEAEVGYLKEKLLARLGPDTFPQIEV